MTNYTYSRRNLLDRKIDIYFNNYINSQPSDHREIPYFLVFDHFCREINNKLKDDHKKTASEKVLLKYLKHKILKENYYIVVIKINKRTKKWEIFLENKPEAKLILSEEQLKKLANSDL
ncbi:MAG: hypothetical protein ACP5GR_05995 [Thermoplasmata archaeon]